MTLITSWLKRRWKADVWVCNKTVLRRRLVSLWDCTVPQWRCIFQCVRMISNSTEQELWQVWVGADLLLPVELLCSSTFEKWKEKQGLLPVSNLRYWYSVNHNNEPIMHFEMFLEKKHSVLHISSRIICLSGCLKTKYRLAQISMWLAKYAFLHEIIFTDLKPHYVVFPL